MLKKLKEKKGVSSIEFVIGLMILLMIACFLLDVMILGFQLQSYSSINSNFTRTLAVQGGVRTSAPTGYPGGNLAYTNSSALNQIVRTNMESSGIQPGSYQIRVNGINFGSNSNIEVDYLGNIRTEIVLTYRWAFTSNFIPGNIVTTHTSRRNTLSEFKYNFNSWRGE